MEDMQSSHEDDNQDTFAIKYTYQIYSPDHVTNMIRARYLERVKRGGRERFRPSGNHNVVRKLLGSLVATTTVALGAGFYNYAKENSASKEAENIEQQAIEAIEKNQLTISDKIIVLNQGAKIRETPARFVSNPDSPRKNVNVPNVVFETPANGHVVITRGLEWVDEERDVWIGFVFASPVEKTENAKLRWINLSALKRESEKDLGGADTSDRTPVTIYDNQYSAYGSEASPETHSYTVIRSAKDNDVLTITNSTDGSSVATGKFVYNHELDVMLDSLLKN